MAIEEIFNTIVCCSCGACCSKDELCENSLYDTLAANGLKPELIDQIRGLSQVARNHGNGFQFSPLYDKIKELRKDYNNYVK